MRPTLPVLFAFALAGCPSDPVTDAGRDAPTADAPAPSDTPAPMDVPGMTDAPADAPALADTPATGEAPVITRVAWTTPASCTAGTTSMYTVTITATDADTAAGMLTYSGSVGGCPGTITAASSMISCPNLAPYDGTVTVRDPEGNMDSVMIRIAPCTDGMVEP